MTDTWYLLCFATEIQWTCGLKQYVTEMYS